MSKAWEHLWCLPDNQSRRWHTVNVLLGLFMRLCVLLAHSYWIIQDCWPTSQNKRFLLGTDNEKETNILRDCNLLAARLLLKTQPIDVGQILSSNNNNKKQQHQIDLCRFLPYVFLNILNFSKQQVKHTASGEWRLLLVCTLNGMEKSTSFVSFRPKAIRGMLSVSL